MRPQLPDTVAAVAGAVTEATPAFAGIADDKFTRDVHTAVQVALDRFLDLVGTGEPALPPRFREVFVGLGAAEAREDRGPEALLAALRMAARLLLRTASRSLARLRPVEPEELIDLSDAVSAYIAELAAASTDGYALQLREQAGEGDRRRHLAELLLRGDGLPSAELAGGLVGPAPGPVFVDDHLVALTLRGEQRALAVLTERRLAPLSQLRPAQRENLLGTLYAWLRHWGSRAEVATELFVHPQTVSYRLKRLRELYGDDLDDPAARFELLVVLTGQLATSIRKASGTSA